MDDDYLDASQVNPRVDSDGYIVDNTGRRLNEYSGARNNMFNPGRSNSYFNEDGTPREGFNQYGISLLGYHRSGYPWTVNEEFDGDMPQVVQDKLQQLRNPSATSKVSRNPSLRTQGLEAPTIWNGDKECSGKTCLISQSTIQSRNGMNPGIKLSDGQCYLASELAKYWKSSSDGKKQSPLRKPYTEEDLKKINDYLSVISGGKKKKRSSKKYRKSKKSKKSKQSRKSKKSKKSKKSRKSRK